MNTVPETAAPATPDREVPPRQDHTRWSSSEDSRRLAAVAAICSDEPTFKQLVRGSYVAAIEAHWMFPDAAAWETLNVAVKLLERVLDGRPLLTRLQAELVEHILDADGVQ